VGDEELLAAWQAGDRHAGEQLVQRHGRALSSFFRHRVSAPAIADLVQQTLLTLCETQHRIRTDSSFRAFAFGVARRKLLSHARARRTVALPDAGLAELQAEDPSATSVLHARFQNNVAIAALRELPLDEQILLELHEHQGLKRRELAVVFDVPMGVIGGRVHRARERLRRIVERVTNDPAAVDSTETSLHSYWLDVHARWSP